MAVRAGRVIAFLALALGVLAFSASAGWAREGFYLGAGFSEQTANGNLDGKTAVLDPASGNQYLLGRLDGGTGIALQIGYGFTKYFGIEYFSAATTHTATFHGQPDTTAALATSLLGVRLTAPVAKSFELFLRGGLSAYDLQYDKYGLTPGPVANKVDYTGTGSAYGVGFEILGDHFGLGVGYTLHYATLTQGKIDGHSTFDLPHHLNVPMTSTDLMFSYHF